MAGWKMDFLPEQLLLCILTIFFAISFAESDVDHEMSNDIQIKTLVKELKGMHAQLIHRDKLTREMLAAVTQRYDSKNHRRKRNVDDHSTGPKGRKGDASSLSSVYIRWGSDNCPNSAQLVYSGYAGGSAYNVQGGGVNYLCLPRDPEYTNPNPQTSSWRGRIYGSVYEIDSFPPLSGKDDGDVACAVCSVAVRGAVLMLPARKTCPKNWQREYHGFLMAAAHQYYRSEWVCVDRSATITSSSSTSNSVGAIFYPVEVRSSSSNSSTGLLPRRYIDGYELTCVVCTQ